MIYAQKEEKEKGIMLPKRIIPLALQSRVEARSKQG